MSKMQQFQTKCMWSAALLTSHRLCM